MRPSNQFASKTKSYLDESVLLSAFRGDQEKNFYEVIQSNNRIFIYSIYLESFLQSDLPEENEFYQLYFAKRCRPLVHTQDESTLYRNARALALRYHLKPLQALQLSYAIEVNIDEYITIKPKTEPIHTVQEVNIVYLEDIIQSTLP